MLLLVRICPRVPAPAPAPGADGRAFAAARDGADDGSDRRAAARKFAGTLVCADAVAALPGNLGSIQPVLLSLD